MISRPSWNRDKEEWTVTASVVNAAWNSIILGLTPDGSPPRKGSPQHITADACATSLAAKREFDPRAVDVSSLLGEDAWAVLVERGRAAATARFEHYGRNVADVDEDVLTIVRSPALLDHLAPTGTRLSGDVEATFLYYKNGEGLPLHLDNDSTYEYNLLFCIEKSFVDVNARPSATYFYLGDGAVKAAVLEPGRGVWFHAGYTPHARMPLLRESEITLFSLGMRRDG